MISLIVQLAELYHLKSLVPQEQHLEIHKEKI